MEKKRAHDVCSLEALGGNIRPAIPGGYWENTISALSEQDARLLNMLFIGEMTVTDTTLSFGCSWKSIWKWRDRILGQICAKMESSRFICARF